MTQTDTFYKLGVALLITCLLMINTAQWFYTFWTSLPLRYFASAVNVIAPLWYEMSGLKFVAPAVFILGNFAIGCLLSPPVCHVLTRICTWRPGESSLASTSGWRFSDNGNK